MDPLSEYRHRQEIREGRDLLVISGILAVGGFAVTVVATSGWAVAVSTLVAMAGSAGVAFALCYLSAAQDAYDSEKGA